MADPWVIAIVGGVAATVLADLLIPSVRRFLRAAGRFALRVLTGAARVALATLTASVPAWALLIVAAAVAILARTTVVPIGLLVAAAMIGAGTVGWIVRWKKQTRRPAIPSSLPTDKTPTGSPLDPLADAIVRRLAQADGASLGIVDLSAAVRTTRLRVEQSLDNLVDIGLVADHRNIMHGPRFTLTPNGRDFAIERRYV